MAAVISDSGAMIKVSSLTKCFGSITAVSNVSFEASPGDIVGFLGPNGAGKTTTLRMLSTFLPPSSGTAEICGYDIRVESHKVREQLGYLPEAPPIYDDLTVLEQLNFHARVRGLHGAEGKSRVEEVMNLCALVEVRRKLCGQLSKGFRQRVGFAQAIIHSPRVLILDEPTSGLDPIQVREMRELIRKLSTECTVLLSTHILPEVRALCSRVMVMNRGEIALNHEMSREHDVDALEQTFLRCVGLDGSEKSRRESAVKAGGAA